MSDAMFYQAIGSSIQANKDKIEKLEKQNARLKKQKKDLQQENQQLKEQVQDLKADYGTIAQIERDLYKEVIEEVREYINHEWFKRGQLGIIDKSFQEWQLKNVLQILDKAKENK